MSLPLRDNPAVDPNCGAPFPLVRPKLLQVLVVVINSGAAPLFNPPDPTDPVIVYIRSEPTPFEFPCQFCNKYMVSRFGSIVVGGGTAEHITQIVYIKI